MDLSIYAMLDHSTPSWRGQLSIKDLASVEHIYVSFQIFPVTKLNCSSEFNLFIFNWWCALHAFHIGPDCNKHVNHVIHVIEAILGALRDRRGMFEHYFSYSKTEYLAASHPRQHGCYKYFSCQLNCFVIHPNLIFDLFSSLSLCSTDHGMSTSSSNLFSVVSFPISLSWRVCLCQRTGLLDNLSSCYKFAMTFSYWTFQIIDQGTRYLTLLRTLKSVYCKKNCSDSGLSPIIIEMIKFSLIFILW